MEVFKLIYSTGKGVTKRQEMPRVQMSNQDDAVLTTGPMDIEDSLYVNPTAVAILRSDIGKFNFTDIETREYFEHLDEKSYRIVRWYRRIKSWFSRLWNAAINLLIFGIGGAALSSSSSSSKKNPYGFDDSETKMVCHLSVFGPRGISNLQVSLRALTSKLPNIEFRPVPGNGLNKLACIKLDGAGDRLCICEPVLHFVCASTDATSIVAYDRDYSFYSRMPSPNQNRLNRRLIERGCVIVSGPCLVFLYTRGDVNPVYILPSNQQQQQPKKETTRKVERLVEPADKTPVSALNPDTIVAYDFGKVEFQWTATPHLRLVNVLAKKKQGRVFVCNE